MAMEIFRLVGSIFVDSDKANESISKTDKHAQGLGSTLASGIGTAAKWTAGLVAGAGAVATGLTALASQTAATSDNIDKMSQRLGLSRESFQELDFVLSQSGVDINSFQTGMKSLLANMDKVSEGNKTAMANFEALGVSVQNADGSLRSEEEVLFDTITAFQAMEDSSEKTRLAQELFGKQGQEIIPLLNSQAGSLEEMRQQARDLGLVLSDETIDAGVTLTDTMDQMKRSLSAVVTNLGGALIPVVRQVAELIIANMPMIQELFAQITPIITQVFTELMPPLIDLATNLFPVIIQLINTVLPILTQLLGDIMPVIIELLNMVLPPLVQIVSALLPPLLSLLQPVLALLQPLIQLLNPILQLLTSLLGPIVNLINSAINPMITVLSTMIGGILPPLQAAMTAVANCMTGQFSAAFETIGDVIYHITGIFQGLIDFVTGVFTGDWGKAWDAVKSIFGNIFGGIIELFKMPINFIIDGINFFIRGLNKLKIPDWVPGVGGMGINIGEIPRLEQGGVLEKGQTGFLEGNGAEAVVPLENNRKWISAVAQDMNAAGLGSSSSEMLALLGDIRDRMDEILTLGVYLDTGAMVGALAKPMDKKLGIFAAQKARA